MKTNNYVYQTISEAMHELMKRGYKMDFSIFVERDYSICNQTAKQIDPDEFEIDRIYYFEGNTDPGDELVYAISSIKDSIKGNVVNAYVMY